MARPIWNGMLSFGLLNIPVQLMPGERRTDLHFRMLDGRDNAPIRYERVNAETGEEVPWKEIVKAYEHSKGNYVVLDEDDFAAAAPGGRETVELEAFVDPDEVSPSYFEKPYVLVPVGKADKGYVLLRETLRRTGKVGIAKVVIRTREYLSMVRPEEDALVLIVLRFPQELIEPAEYKLPSGKPADFRVTAKELEMAAQVIASMSGAWRPEEFHDESRARLHAAIERRKKEDGVVSSSAAKEEAPEVTANVVDFMSLLKQSLEGRKPTSAKSGAAVDAPQPKRAPAKRVASKKAPSRRKAATKGSAKASPRHRKAG